MRFPPVQRKRKCSIWIGIRRIYNTVETEIMGDMNAIVQVRISLHSENGPVVSCSGLRNDISLSRELQRILMDQEYSHVSQ